MMKFKELWKFTRKNKVQSQKVVLTRIMCKNVVFRKKNDGREKSFLLEKGYEEK
jgi:hypothetical protein